MTSRSRFGGKTSTATLQKSKADSIRFHNSSLLRSNGSEIMQNSPSMMDTNNSNDTFEAQKSDILGYTGPTKQTEVTSKTTAEASRVNLSENAIFRKVKANPSLSALKAILKNDMKAWKNLQTATEKAEKREVVRKELGRFMVETGYQKPFKLSVGSTSDSDDDMKELTEEQKKLIQQEQNELKQKAKIMKMKNAMGFNYDKLITIDLVDVNANNKHYLDVFTNPAFLIKATAPPQEEHVAKKEENNPIASGVYEKMRKLISDFEKITWMDEAKKQYFINTFVADLANRYNRIKSLTSPHFTPTQNRNLAIRIFEKIDGKKDRILEKCRKKLEDMDTTGIFNKETNFERVLTFFRTELSKKINTDELWEEAVEEVQLNKLGKLQAAASEMTVNTDDYLSNHVQKIKNELDSITHPTPQLQPPVVKDAKKGVQRKNTATVSAIQNMLGIQGRIGRFRRGTGVEVDSSVKKQQNGIPNAAAQHLAKLMQEQQKLLDVHQQKRSQASALVIKSRTSGLDGVGFENYIPEELLQIDDNDEVLPRFDGEKEVRRADVSSHGLVESIMHASPILHAHSKAPRYRRRQGVADENTEEEAQSEPKGVALHEDNPKTEQAAEIQEKENVQRYIPIRGERKTFLNATHYAMLETASENAKPKSKRPYSNLEDVPFDSAILRTVNSKFPARTPRSVIHISLDKAREIQEVRQEVGSSTKKEMLDERLMRAREIEELYGEIMKTVNSNHMDFTELPDACPSAPFDPDTPLSLLYQGLVLPESDDDEDNETKDATKEAKKKKKKIEDTNNPSTQSEDKSKEKPAVLDKMEESLDPEQRRMENIKRIKRRERQKRKEYKKRLRSLSPARKQEEKIDTFEQEQAEEESEDSVDYENIPRPEIRMLTRDGSQTLIPADEYAHNRDAAMRKTPSSRYTALQYNFGGYIPAQSKVKTKKKETTVSISNFKTFLRRWDCDFLTQVIRVEDEDRAKMMKELEEQEKRRLEEREKKAIENERRQRMDQKKNLRAFTPNEWNTGVLQYIDEIAQGNEHEKDDEEEGLTEKSNILRYFNTYGEEVDASGILVSAKGGNDTKAAEGLQTIAEDTNTKPVTPTTQPTSAQEQPTGSTASVAAKNADRDAEKQSNEGGSLLSIGDPENAQDSQHQLSSGSQDKKSDIDIKSTTSMLFSSTDKSMETVGKPSVQASRVALEDEQALRIEFKRVFLSESRLHVSRTQDSFEKIWQSLKMPEELQLKMAVKYASPTFNGKLDRALSLWSNVCEAITRREELLGHLEEFEKERADPTRFFKPKTEFDSLDLIDETEERESILGQIKKLGNNIKELATEIKTELHETVTYEGISYIEKMKKDISKSMFKAQKERRQYSESVESSRPSSVQSNSSLTSIKKSPPTSDRASLVFTPLATEHTPIATTETANEAVSRVPTKIKISEDVAELDGNKVPPSTRVTAPTKSILKKKNETEGEQESAIQEDK